MCSPPPQSQRHQLRPPRHAQRRRRRRHRNGMLATRLAAARWRAHRGHAGLATRRLLRSRGRQLLSGVVRALRPRPARRATASSTTTRACRRCSPPPKTADALAAPLESIRLAAAFRALPVQRRQRRRNRPLLPQLPARTPARDIETRPTTDRTDKHGSKRFVCSYPSRIFVLIRFYPRDPWPLCSIGIISRRTPCIGNLAVGF